MNLSPHFTLEELTRSEIALRKNLSNRPGPEALENLRRLAPFLERVRELPALGGRPILVNSGYRSGPVNAAVGGKPTSQHPKGQAADIRVPGMDPEEVVRAIIASSLPYDQVICEFNAWTHVSIPAAGSDPRKQALTIDRDGTRSFA
jgi:hypothetical protein